VGPIFQRLLLDRESDSQGKELGVAGLKIRAGKLGRLEHWLSRRRRTSLGRWGEWVALCYLQSLGLDILARNWRVRQGELDLVAFEGDTLVIFEVKTRLIPAPLPPEAAVTDRKRDQLERLAIRFTARYELEGMPVRFDLIAIETPDRRTFELRHYCGFLET